jgi:hypothetical protein
LVTEMSTQDVIRKNPSTNSTVRQKDILSSFKCSYD